MWRNLNKNKQIILNVLQLLWTFYYYQRIQGIVNSKWPKSGKRSIVQYGREIKKNKICSKNDKRNKGGIGEGCRENNLLRTIKHFKEVYLPLNKTDGG